MPGPPFIADEGLLVGYFINNKAFRVYNSRTRKVEENLHVNFFENKPNVARSSPEWLFDIDSLTNSMKYQPVSARNRTNGNVGLEINSDAGQAGKEKVHLAALDDFTKMPNLEDTRIFDDAYDNKDEGAEADYNNLETVISVSPIPSTRIHKDHPKEKIIREVNSTVQTRKMAKQNKAARLAAHRQEEGIDYDEVFAPVARIEAIRLFLAYASFMDFTVYQMNVKSAFLYGTIKEEVYVSQPPGYVDLEFPDRVKYSNEIHKPLSKDADGTDVDVHLYRLISWQCKKQTIVANSTTKAEYIVASNYCGQVLRLQNQLLDYGYNFMQIKIYVDNESAICVVKNLIYHLKTKHIEIRHHFIRDSYEERLIEMVKIHTDYNVSDLLIKAFDVTRF
nr:putative ribonuclease H-like domain-containing protein [Tanacetum cinerariifolium]